MAIYELQADEVFIIGHHDCGMSSIDTNHIIDKMVDRGIDKNLFKTLQYSGIDMKDWLHGFSDVTESVKKSVDIVRNHPFMDTKYPSTDSSPILTRVYWTSSVMDTIYRRKLKSTYFPGNDKSEGHSEPG